MNLLPLCTELTCPSLSSLLCSVQEREIHAMSKINHQNVIRLKEVNWDCTYEKKNGTKLQVILVVLELATGGELFDFLAFTGPFEEAIARTYFQQLIAGIAHWSVSAAARALIAFFAVLAARC